MKLLFLWTSAAHSDRQPDQSHAAERTEEGQAGGGGRARWAWGWGDRAKLDWEDGSGIHRASPVPK